VNLVQLERRPIGAYPQVPLVALDSVWFQVAGTLCNLECTHCFISSSPTNRSFEMMTEAEVAAHLEEARGLGVRAYYFTGGEPFLNKAMVPILARTLAQGPACVLTNGIPITARLAGELSRLSAGSEYSLELRISIDGYDAQSNDPIRGEGSFEKILLGVGRLAEVGLNPVITVTEACEGVASRAGRLKFLEVLRALGLSQPRLKILPLLRMGAEEKRLRPYQAHETLAGVELDRAAIDKLECGHARMVTKKGVYVCPILIDHPGARLAATLTESLVPFGLSYSACYTCHAEGLSCAT
jgi:molybdenum cofactor biosynthesis enzyme MoaA